MHHSVLHAQLEDPVHAFDDCPDLAELSRCEDIGNRPVIHGAVVTKWVSHYIFCSCWYFWENSTPILTWSLFRIIRSYSIEVLISLRIGLL